MKRILVTGCGPASTNFVKSLRIVQEKFFIVQTDANKYHTYLSLAERTYLVPKATDPEYISKLNEIIEKEMIEFLHPQPDIEVRVIGKNRDKVGAVTFLPSQRAIEICQDKYKSYECWKRKGLPVPKTVEIERESDITKAFDELGAPIWIRAKHGAGGRGSTPAENEEAAISWIKYWKSRGVNWEFIAQEYLPGRNIAFHSLWKNGELIISMARERLEYIYPYLAPSGITGTPSVQKTIHDEEVNKIATEAVLSIDPNFSGIACVDLKENSQGIPCPTEINAGRMFTTSFFFSLLSNVLYKDYRANFPYLYIKLAYKEEIPDLPKYNILPKNVYWIRHMDSPGRIVMNGKILGVMYR